jgi:uncharacterized protein YeaO (DUF488 family)
MPRIALKRVYEAPSSADGMRILVDRLWPRGLAKKDAAVDLWCKEVAPSDGLRKWFGHDPERWAEFRRRYREELREQPEALRELKAAMRGRSVTLLFGAKDEEHNNAVALKDLLSRAPRRKTKVKAKRKAKARDSR